MICYDNCAAAAAASVDDDNWNEMMMTLMTMET